MEGGECELQGIDRLPALPEFIGIDMVPAKSSDCNFPSSSSVQDLPSRRAPMLAKCEVNRLTRTRGPSKWSSVCVFGRPTLFEDRHHKYVGLKTKAMVSVAEESPVSADVHVAGYYDLIAQVMASSAISLANAAVAAAEEAAALAAEEHALDKLLLEEQVLLRGDSEQDGGAHLHAESSGRSAETVVKSGRRLRRLKTSERAEKAMELQIEASKVDVDHLRLQSRKRGLLSADEELCLIIGVQEFGVIEKARTEFMERMQREPTVREWATASGIEARRFNERLLRGRMAKDKMIRYNMGLITMVARTYVHHGLPLEDLMQDGSEGFIRGVEKFDPSKGFKLSTYVYWWIKQAIGKAVARKARPVRLPVHYFEFLSKIKRVKWELVEQLGRQPSDQQIAEAAGVKVAKLQAMMLWSRKVQSFDVPVGPEKNMSLHELTPDENDQKETRLLMLKHDVDKTLKQLTPREEQVVRERFGLNGGRAKTLEEIGALFSLTRERIRQIEIRAMGKLKNSEVNRHLRLHFDM